MSKSNAPYTSEPCAMDENEPCETCSTPRKYHRGIQDHDYEPSRVYRCLGCANDVVYDSDNIGGHPGYDHDFAPVAV